MSEIRVKDYYSWVVVWKKNTSNHLVLDDNKLLNTNKYLDEELSSMKTSAKYDKLLIDWDDEDNSWVSIDAPIKALWTIVSLSSIRATYLVLNKIVDGKVNWKIPWISIEG